MTNENGGRCKTLVQFFESDINGGRVLEMKVPKVQPTVNLNKKKYIMQPNEMLLDNYISFWVKKKSLFLHILVNISG